MKNHLAFAMYKSKYAVFCPKFFFKNCQKPSIYAGFRDFQFTQVTSRSKPILPIFSFVLAGHKGLEDLGRVVVFVLC